MHRQRQPKLHKNSNTHYNSWLIADWLLDHKAEFQLMVMNKYGKNFSESIEWENSRLICIAGDYTKYDSYAVQQINRNIELIRYKKFEDLILFELVNATSEEKEKSKPLKKQKTSKTKITVADYFEKCSQQLKDLYQSLDAFILGLGEGIQLKKLERYFAYKKIKTFASMKFQPQTNTIVVWVRIDISTIKLEKGFTRDVTRTGHHGLGGLEIRIKTSSDFERAKPLIIKSYELN